MSYVLVGILLLLIASAFVAYLVVTGTKRSSPARESGAPGIGADDTPLGDTAQHSDVDSAGESATRPDDGTAEEGRFQRDKIGGEAEASPYLDSPRS